MTPPRYQPFYCEENVWWLADQHPGRRCRAVFISNLNRQVLLLGQRAGREPDGLTMWDYHVVLKVALDDGWYIHDLDCTRGGLLPIEHWVQVTFADLPTLFPVYAPCFREVDHADYRATFSSDRGHMRTPDDGWRRPPPEWPALGGQGQPPSNLMNFVDMTTPFIGRIGGFVELLSPAP
jgi:protein N-terminal glutamine amidohydrolase